MRALLTDVGAHSQILCKIDSGDSVTRTRLCERAFNFSVKLIARPRQLRYAQQSVNFYVKLKSCRRLLFITLSNRQRYSQTTLSANSQTDRQTDRQTNRQDGVQTFLAPALLARGHQRCSLHQIYLYLCRMRSLLYDVEPLSARADKDKKERKEQKNPLKKRRTCQRLGI